MKDTKPNEYTECDWPGDMLVLNEEPNICRVCEVPFLGHTGRSVCRRCDTSLRRELMLDEEALRLKRLRVLLLVVLPTALLLWVLIYFIARAVL